MDHVRTAEGNGDPLPLEQIVRGRSGDRSALAQLVRRYQGRVARLVIAETRDRDHCEDLCQAVFVRMVLALPRLREAERFEPWLFQIARNACRDHLRRRKSWRRLFVPYAAGHESVSADAPDERRSDDALDRGMAQLPENQRMLLKLSLERPRSYEELATLSRASPSSVKSRLWRARQNLRHLLLTGEAE